MTDETASQAHSSPWCTAMCPISMLSLHISTEYFQLLKTGSDQTFTFCQWLSTLFCFWLCLTLLRWLQNLARQWHGPPSCNKAASQMTIAFYRLQELTEGIQNIVKVKRHEHVVFYRWETLLFQRSSSSTVHCTPLSFPDPTLIWIGCWNYGKPRTTFHGCFTPDTLVLPNLDIFSLRGSLNQELKLMKWKQSWITLVLCNPLCSFVPNSAEG